MRSYLFTFLVALVLALGLTPLAGRLGLRVGAVDRTKGGAIPRAGGIAILLAATLGLLLISLVWSPVRSMVIYSGTALRAVYFGALAILALGIVDDIHRLKAMPKLLVEIGVAVALYFAGVRAASVWLPFGIVELGNVLGLLFTVAWIVGITNAFNLLDGIDGAAAGAAVFALLAMFAVSVALGQPLVALRAVALAGATLGFLPFNFPPARIYLGDAGSLVLGFMLAVLAIEGATKGPAIVAIAIPLVAFGLPLMDTLMAVVFTMIVTIAWLTVRHLRLHEFFELARVAQRGMLQTRAIGFNVQLRRAADDLDKAGTWDDIVTLLAKLFAESEFDAVRLVVQRKGPSGYRHEYRLQNGAVVAGHVDILDDEWGVHLPFQIGHGDAHGELAVFRRYGRSALLTDVNLIVETLRPSLSRAAGRVTAPALA